VREIEHVEGVNESYESAPDLSATGERYVKEKWDIQDTVVWDVASWGLVDTTNFQQNCCLRHQDGDFNFT
jgi:hypothetical protein